MRRRICCLHSASPGKGRTQSCDQARHAANARWRCRECQFNCACSKCACSETDIPWVLYQLDLGHNFVLAHRECNSSKRDRLASETHLAGWIAPNEASGGALREEFDRLGIPHNLDSTNRIARWAYSSTSSIGGRVRQAQDILLPLAGDWRGLLN
jgi:hypothetical protein